MIEKHWAVESAKSSRAVCKKCFERIPVKKLRWADHEVNKVTGGVITKHYHVDCLPVGVQLDENEVEGLGKVAKEDRDTVLQVLRSRHKPGGTKRKASDTIGPKEYDMFRSGVPKKAKRTVDYESLTRVELEDFLRMNRQLQIGSRSELVERCREMSKNGRLLPCPTCGLGQLALRQDGKVACHGHWDRDIEMRDSCDFEANADDERVRRGKWLIPGLDDPIESLFALKGENMDETMESHKLDILSRHTLLSEWEKQGKEETEARILLICRKLKISLPDSDSNSETIIEKKLKEHGWKEKLKTDQIIEIVEQVVKALRVEFGMKISRADIEAARIVTPAAKSTVRGNNWLADEIDRLGDLEAHDGSSTSMWKARANHRAASAIRQVKFHITDGKSLKGIRGIGKGTIAHVDELLQHGKLGITEKPETAHEPPKKGK